MRVGLSAVSVEGALKNLRAELPSWDFEGTRRAATAAGQRIRKLDELFTNNISQGRHVPDFSGTIGQYAHGNEPSHHVAYLYSYAGAPLEDAGARPSDQGGALHRAT